VTVYGTLSDNLIRAYAPTERARRTLILNAWKAYDGLHPASLMLADDAPDDNLRLAYPELLVDTNVMALFGTEPEWKLNGEGEESESPEAVAFEAWEEDQGLLVTLQRIATAGGIGGTAFYKIDVEPDDPMPEVKVLDPARVQMFCDPDDDDDCWAYLIEWETINTDGRKVYRRQIIERTSSTSWTIRDEEARDQGGRYAERAAPITWPYDWPPIGCCQNLPAPRGCYGKPDLTIAAIDTCYGINRVMSNTNKIIRLHAHPKLIGTGFDAESVRLGPDEMVTLSNPEAKISAIEMSSDLASSISFHDKLLDAFHETNRLPAVATGKLDNTGQLSGVALRILYGPLVQQIEQKRLTYGPMVEEMIRRVMLLMGHTVDVTTTWPEIVPGDPLQERQVAQIDAALGASKQTILTQLGYDAQTEVDAAQAEAQNAFNAQAQAWSQGMPGPSMMG
jgi:hypothetical protein